MLFIFKHIAKMAYLNECKSTHIHGHTSTVCHSCIVHLQADMIFYTVYQHF